MPGLPRYAPDEPLPPYSYVPGAGFPHPVNDPDGHLAAKAADDAVSSTDTSGADDRAWRFAADLFNHGFYWEAHEAWEGLWKALGRTTPAARRVQGLIHLAAACVKVREGRPTGVKRHAARARELLDDPLSPPLGCVPFRAESLAALLAELEAYAPACWHTARANAVRVLAAGLELATDEP